MENSDPNWRLFFIGGLCFLSCLAYGVFGERPFDIEEFAHFNIPYMVANYHEASFPSYYIWEQVYVHPPTHYFFIGKLLKFFSLHYALIAVPLFFIAIAIYFSVTSKISSAEKLGFVLAVYCFVITCLNTTVNFSVRPDMCYTLCWIAGLLGLEKSRRDNWNRVPLAAGTALLSLASIYHFPAMPAVLGFLVYIVAIKMDLSWRPFFQRLAVILFIACVAGIPFLVMYFIPNFDNIYSYLIIGNTEHSPLKSIWETFFYHLKYHGRMDSNWLEYFYQRKIPVGILSIIGLAILPPTRLIGLAASPVILFVTFIVKTKRDYYLLPEWIVFYIFLFSLLFFLSEKFFIGKIKARLYENAFLLLGFVIVILTFYWSPKLNELLHHEKSVQYHPIDISRAASQSIVGQDALIGGVSGIWYLSGARYWYNEDRELLYQFLENEDEYLFSADYFSDYAFGSYGENYAMGGTVQRLAGLYVKNDLSLCAVIFHKNFTYCLYSKKHAQPNGFHVFVHDQDSVRHFIPDEQGDYINCSFTGMTIDSSLNPGQEAEMYVPYLTQLEAGNPQQVLYLTCRQENLNGVKQNLGERWSLNQSYRTSLEVLSHKEFLERHPINPKENFYVNQEKALSRESKYQMN